MPKQTKTKSSKAKSAFVLLALLVLLLASVGIWYWQQTKIDEQVDKNRALANSNKQLSGEKKNLMLQLTAAKDEVTGLDKKNVSLEKELSLIKNPEQAKLRLSVDLTRHNKATYNESGTDLVYVDLTVVNESKIDGYFNLYNLQLKDSSNRVHPLCENSAIGYYVCRSGLTLPKGKVELKSTHVRAGETVKGTVAFYVPKTLNIFTISYGDQTIQLNAG